ncbi:hypothetical protein [Marivibrio halodurans]|uniref:hypothetical protein n=1 Tax=Marivibrio halodurans TaxID=2039722 RepID=UPI001B3393C9|nr:hypothetical protein [Marivibrio halodurans]
MSARTHGGLNASGREELLKGQKLGEVLEMQVVIGKSVGDAVHPGCEALAFLEVLGPVYFLGDGKLRPDLCHYSPGLA